MVTADVGDHSVTYAKISKVERCTSPVHDGAVLD